MSSIHAPHFTDETAAREYLEKLRWPEGPVCPHCGTVNHAYATKRPGLYRCASKECRKDFSVTVGTVYERSKIPLHKWLLASYLLCSSKKGMSSHQLHRMLGVTYKTAWFMTMRIREAMTDGYFSGPLGGNGKAVEVDETYFGNEKPKATPTARGGDHKMKILSLVEREGRVRSHHVPSVNAKTLAPIMKEQIAQDTHLMTDDAAVYLKIGQHFAEHSSVNHSAGEYVRGAISTNTVESYFAILKRGLIGTYHHVSPEHLRRYVGEFDFRYNNRSALGVEDKERADIVLKNIAGKRLTYRRTNEKENQAA
jgi:transposase-like protein